VSDAKFRLQPLSDVEPRAIQSLVPGLIPLRVLTLVAGVGGLGKSMWLVGIAARLSVGELHGFPPSDTVIVSYEDTAAEVIRPRVEAASGDPSRIHVVVPERRFDDVTLPSDVPELAALVGSVGARLLVIDPIVAGIELQLSAHRDQDVRVVLAQLTELAETADCAVVLVAHLNKTPSTDAYFRIANSAAFYNASRSVLLFTEDERERDDDYRLISQRKANYAQLQPVERWRVEEVSLEDHVDPTTGEPITVARIGFVEIAADVDGADVLSAHRTDGKSAQAIAFLAEALANGDWHDREDLWNDASAQGISERTFKRASQALNVEKQRLEEFGGGTRWRLPQPETAQTPARPPSAPDPGPTGDSADLSGSDPSEAAVGPVRPTPAEVLATLPDNASDWERAYWERRAAEENGH
jgi:AAA domain